MKYLIAATLLVVVPPAVIAYFLWKMVQELEHVADNMGDTDEWWNDVFDGYEWDDDWVDGGWSEHYDPA